MRLAELFDNDGSFLGRIPTTFIQSSVSAGYYVVGDDFSARNGLKEIQKIDGQKSEYIGKLNSLNDDELSFYLKYFLDEEGWNFELWPNPEVILIEKI